MSRRPGVTLIEVLEELEGRNFTLEVRLAWLRAYTFAAGMMMATAVTGLSFRPSPVTEPIAEVSRA